MKITIVCDVLGAENNGTTIAAMNLIRFMQERGHDVRILCCDQNKKGMPNYYVSPIRSFGIFDKYVEKNGVSLAKPDNEVIRQALEGVDLVHIMLPFSLGVRAEKIAKEMGIPVSVGCHQLAENLSTHVYMQNVKFVNNAIYHHFKKFYQNADNIHYVTPYLRTLYESMYGKTDGQAISNGVSDVFTPAEKPVDISDGVNIVYTGRYSREKSHKTLIKAIALCKNKDKIHLILPGSGPLKNSIEEQCKNAGISAQMGFVDRDKMPEMLRACYLYVHAAEIEAEGIACLEAISCGVVPVINNSPRCATKSYAIDEKNTFENNDSQSLADRIDYWIDNYDEYCARRQEYIKLSSKLFSRKSCMEQMEKMFFDTIERCAKKRQNQAQEQ